MPYGYTNGSDQFVSGIKMFDGYEQQCNLLIDAKNWSGSWPTPNVPSSYQSQALEMEQEDQIAGEAGSAVEYRVATPEGLAMVNQIISNSTLTHSFAIWYPGPVSK